MYAHTIRQTTINKMDMLHIEKIWLTDDAIWIRTADGREAAERFADYPRLARATADERARYLADGAGIHWPELDEDLCYEGFFAPKTHSPLYDFFMAHPELDASAVARRMKMPQSLLAQYLSGARQLSEQGFEEIVQTVRSIGRELVEV